MTFIPGTYTLTAQYNGDGNYAASTATPVTVIITPVTIPLTGTVTELSSATPNPAAGGTPVTFTGTVASNSGSGVPPTGTVALNAGNKSLGTATVRTDGSFTLTTTALPVGVGPVTATYSGDSTYATSTSTPITVTVTGITVSADDSITTLDGVTPNPASTGTIVILRGSVASAIGANLVPTGLVTLFDGDAPIGQAALLGDGTFTFQTSSLPVGTDALTARYQGDSVYTASASAAVPEVITSGVVPSFGPAVLPASVVAGAAFTGKVPLTITNQASDQKGKFTINLYADTADSLDGTQTLLQSTSKSFALKSGKSRPFSLKLKSLPASLPVGAYHLLAQVVDPTGVASVATLSTTVNVAAPFVALSATVGPLAPATLVAGRSASVLVTVTNTGNTLATGSLTVAVGPSTVAATLGSVTHGVKIKPGKFTKVKVRFKYDGALPAGQYTLQAIATIGAVTTTSLGGVFSA